MSSCSSARSSACADSRAAWVAVRASSSDLASASAPRRRAVSAERCSTSACSADTLSLNSRSASGPGRPESTMGPGSSMSASGPVGGGGNSGGAGGHAVASLSGGGADERWKGAAGGGAGADAGAADPGSGTATTELPTHSAACPSWLGSAQVGTVKVASQAPGDSAAPGGSAGLGGKRWRRPWSWITSSGSCSSASPALSQRPLSRSLIPSPSPRRRSTRSMEIGVSAEVRSVILGRAAIAAHVRGLAWLRSPRARRVPA